jgi:hypothetical protein
MEFQLLRAQISELRARLDILEAKDAGAGNNRSRDGSFAVLMLPQISEHAAHASSTPNA